MDEKDALHQFTRGLQYEAKLQVLLKEPATIQQAYRAAEAYEAAYECAQGARKQATRPDRQAGSETAFRSQPPVMTEGPTPMDLDAIRMQWHQRRPQTSHSQEKQCFNCSGYGHIARNCSSPKRQGKSNASNRGHPKALARRA
jgi:hypothetical protein